MGKLIAYVVDTETTSLDATKGDIIEISLLRTSDMQQKTWNMKPAKPDNIQDAALKVNGISKDDLLWKTAAGKSKYRLVHEVLPEIENWVADDGCKIYDSVLVGQNISFDQGFLLSCWGNAECMDSYPFSKYGNTIDTKGLALFFDWINGENNERYSLSALIKKYGLEKRSAHNAADDVLMTHQLFMHFVNMVKK